jgi:hypothetical protein
MALTPLARDETLPILGDLLSNAANMIATNWSRASVHLPAKHALTDRGGTAEL